MNIVDRLLPTALTAPMITTAISEAIKPCSMKLELCNLAARSCEQVPRVRLDVPEPRQTEALVNFGNLLHWAVVFLVIAIIAAVLGFGGIAGFAVEIAKIIFFVAIVLFLISAVVGLMRGRTPTTMP